MTIIVGGFFLYALFFSGMMLARRQIEFLFLFLISPIVFATSFGLGVGASALGKVGGNKLVNSIGEAIQKFGNNIKSNNSPNSNPIKSGIQNGIGNTIEKFGDKVKNSTPSNIGKNMRMHGCENMGEAVSSIMPQRNMYRRRYRNDRPLYRTSYAHAIFNTIYFY